MVDTPAKPRPNRLLIAGGAIFGLFLVADLTTTSISPAPNKPSAAEKAVKPQDHKTAVSEARVYWKALNEATKTCTDTAKYVTRAIAANDAQNLYENGKAAQNNCLISADKIDSLTLPEHAPENVRIALTEESKAMSTTYTLKSQNYGTVATMVNSGMGSFKPSEVAELKQNLSLSVYRELISVAKISDAFKLEGVSTMEYSGLDGHGVHQHHHHHA